MRYVICSILALLIFAAPAQSQWSSFDNTKPANTRRWDKADDDIRTNWDALEGVFVDSSQYASLTAAIADIGATETRLFISEAETLTGSITFPATLTVVFLRGGSIAAASTYTVTFNGQLVDLSHEQIFSGFTASDDYITFGPLCGVTATPQMFGAEGDGSTDDENAIESAIAARDDNGGDVYFPATSAGYLVSTAVTVPTNVKLVFAHGAYIKSDGSATLAINGPVVAEPTQQIFSAFTSATANAVTFGQSSVPCTYPDWWVNNATPGTTDMQDAIIASGLNPMPTRFLASTYAVSDSITIEPSVGNLLKGKQFIGAGQRQTIIDWDGAAASPVWILLNMMEPEVRELWIQGDAAAAPSYGLEIRLNAATIVSGVSVLRAKIHNVDIGADVADDMVTGVGWTTTNGDQNNDQGTMVNCHVFNCSGAAITIEHTQSLAHVFVNCLVSACDEAVECTASGGSFTWYGGACLNVVNECFKLGTTTTVCPIIAAHSEGCGRLLTGSTTVSATQVVRDTFFANNSLNVDNNAINYTGNILIEGCTFGSGQADIGFINVAKDGGGFQDSSITAIANTWINSVNTDPPTSPFRSADVHLISQGNNMSVSGGTSPQYLADYVGPASGYQSVLDSEPTRDSFNTPQLSQSFVDVNSVEIKALAATPVELVAAQGAGTLVEIVNVVLLLNYGSEVLAEPSAPDDLAIEYDGGTGYQLVTFDTTGFITSAADAMMIMRPGNVNGGAAAVTTAANVNKNVVLLNTGGEYTGNASNDTTMRVITNYRVHRALGL